MTAHPKQAQFIAGMKAASLSPDELQRRLDQYFKHEARLADIVRQQIFRAPLIRPQARLDRFVRSYKPGRPAVYEESEARVLVMQLADLVDEFGNAIEKFEQAGSVIAKQRDLGTPGAPVFKAGEQCIVDVSNSVAGLKKTLKSVQVPKPVGKPEVTVKEVYAAASIMITAALVVAEVSRRVLRWRDESRAAMR